MACNTFEPSVADSPFSCVQRAAMMISETIPMTIMLMPAAQGALSRSFETYAAYLGDMGLLIPGNLPAALALTTTAAVAGLAKLLEHGISPEEYNVSISVRNKHHVLVQFSSASDDHKGTVPQQCRALPSAGVDRAERAHVLVL